MGRQRLPVLAARFFDAATVTRGCAQRQMYYILYSLRRGTYAPVQNTAVFMYSAVRMTRDEVFHAAAPYMR